MKREQGLTLGEKAVDGLLQLIQERDYRPGDKLPTEPELAEILGVSRNMVREALRVLVSRNIVVIRQGAGTFLSEKQGVVDDPFGFAMVKDKKKLTRDVLQVRSIIEPSIAALAAENGTAEEVSELREILEQLESKMMKREEYSKLDALFHKKIAECTHNTMMVNLIPVITEGIEIFSREVSVTEYEDTIKAHRNIYEAIAGRKALEAQQEMLYHILYNHERYQREQKDEKSGEI